jgi:hypothetical protein
MTGFVAWHKIKTYIFLFGVLITLNGNINSVIEFREEMGKGPWVITHYGINMEAPSPWKSENLPMASFT